MGAHNGRRRVGARALWWLDDAPPTKRVGTMPSPVLFTPYVCMLMNIEGAAPLDWSLPIDIHEYAYTGSGFYYWYSPKVLEVIRSFPQDTLRVGGWLALPRAWHALPLRGGGGSGFSFYRPLTPTYVYVVRGEAARTQTHDTHMRMMAEATEVYCAPQYMQFI